MGERPAAREWIDLALDEASRQTWDEPPAHGDLSDGHAAELAEARERSGVDESVLTGEGLMRGRRVAVVVGEFGFLAGSIGRAAADRLIAAGRVGRGRPGPQRQAGPGQRRADAVRRDRRQPPGRRPRRVAPPLGADMGARPTKRDRRRIEDVRGR